MVLLQVFYINPYGIYKWWYKGLLLMACMALSILIFGGAVVCLWHLWETRIAEREGYEDGAMNADQAQHNENVTPRDSFLKNPSSSTLTKYGERPDFKGMFTALLVMSSFLRGKKKKG